MAYRNNEPHNDFEAIHPFVDGSGRAGRILDILTPVQAGLIEGMKTRWTGDDMPTKPQFRQHIPAIYRRCRHINQGDHAHSAGFDKLDTAEPAEVSRREHAPLPEYVPFPLPGPVEGSGPNLKELGYGG